MPKVIVYYSSYLQFILNKLVVTSLISTLYRLQARVAKCNERVSLEIEVSAQPEPTVEWFKDDKPLQTAQISPHKISSSGNFHKLVIEKGKIEIE